MIPSNAGLNSLCFLCNAHYLGAISIADRILKKVEKNLSNAGERWSVDAGGSAEIGRGTSFCCVHARGKARGGNHWHDIGLNIFINNFLKMIRKLKSGEYRLYSRKRNSATGARRNLGTFGTLDAARRHERQVQFFKRH